MDNKLKALIDIVNRRGVAKVDLFDVSEEKARQSAYYKMYQAIATNKFDTEDDLAKYLYGTDAQAKSYLMLKSRLTSKLLNNLFFMDYADMHLTEYNQENILSYKNLYSSKILLNNGLRQLGAQYLLRTLNKALKYHFTEIALSCALNLRYHYSLTADRHKADIHDKLVHELTEQYVIENDAARMYELLIAGYAKRNYDPRVLDEAAHFLEELVKYPPKSISFNTHMHVFRIRSMYHILKNEYAACVKACDDLEQYLEQNPTFNAKARMAEIGQNRLSVYVDTNEFNLAKTIIQKYLPFFDAYSYNWFLFLDKYLHMCMLNGNYTEAAEYYQKITSATRFKNLPEQYQEKFKIYRAFMYYMDVYATDLPKFNTRKYLNDVPAHSKDKLGYNIAVLISQILIAIKDKDYDLIHQRGDALLTYSYRHLNKPANKRSNIFIKMLSRLEHDSFMKNDTIEATKQLLKQLKAQRRPGWLYEDIMEVVPYEVLWDKVLTYLD